MLKFLLVFHFHQECFSSTAVCVTKPVGAEDSFSDHRFSASSFKAGKEPSNGRLNGGSAWIPSTNGNNSDFLEIDLGSVYFICGVVTQGNPSADEWTTEFKLETSLNNKNWTTYEENGVEKVLKCEAVDHTNFGM